MVISGAVLAILGLLSLNYKNILISFHLTSCSPFFGLFPSLYLLKRFSEYFLIMIILL